MRKTGSALTGPIAVAMVLAAAGAMAAESYPDRPLRLIVAFTPGGSPSSIRLPERRLVMRLRYRTTGGGFGKAEGNNDNIPITHERQQLRTPWI